jgi:hypothetical protein
MRAVEATMAMTRVACSEGEDVGGVVVVDVVGIVTP